MPFEYFILYSKNISLTFLWKILYCLYCMAIWKHFYDFCIVGPWSMMRVRPIAKKIGRTNFFRFWYFWRRYYSGRSGYCLQIWNPSNSLGATGRNINFWKTTKCRLKATFGPRAAEIFFARIRRLLKGTTKCTSKLLQNFLKYIHLDVSLRYSARSKTTN